MDKQPTEKQKDWTRADKKLRAKLAPCLASGTLAVIFVASGLGFAWADTGAAGIADIKATDAIKNNPAAVTILQEIELFNQRWQAQKQAQTIQDQQYKLIEQQRALAQQYLQNDLNRMENANTQTSPQRAFANFVSTVNNQTQGVFADEFGYMQAKVQQANAARDQTLQNGGTLDEAMQAFNNAASTHKDELVSVNNAANVKHGLASQDVQSLFDKWGQMPR